MLERAAYRRKHDQSKGRANVMRSVRVVPVLLLAILTLVSCSKKEAEKRPATVLLNDGSQISGLVVKSSDSEITLAGGDNITRTIPMSQVKSVQYAAAEGAQTAAPAEAVAPTETAAAPAPAAKTAAPPVAKSEPEPARPSPAPVKAVPQTPPAPLARVFELPAGTELSVRTNEAIDSAKSAGGNAYAAEVAGDVVNSAGTVVVPKGSKAELVVVSASQGGKIRGASDLVLTLASVTVGATSYPMEASNIEQRGKEGVGANKRTATYTGGGAAVGAIIGAIAGGGKGAAIGAGAGAGAGALTQILTKGRIRVPAESVLGFKLEAPLRIVAE
jgi:hypothetical protein